MLHVVTYYSILIDFLTVLIHALQCILVKTGINCSFHKLNSSFWSAVSKVRIRLCTMPLID